MKLIIIGLDGADWKIMQPLLDEGLLPNLAQLMHEGVYGNLVSTTPPLTPCAWTTLLTGVNPGKHGIFDFVHFTCGEEPSLTGGGRRKVPLIWHQLNEQELSVGSFNVPFTYPPEAIDGYMVAGMDAPHFGPEMARPPEVFDALRDEIGEYSLQPGQELHARVNPRGENIADHVNQAAAAAGLLLDRYPTDVFMMVFTVTDFVQHGFLGDRRLVSVTGQVFEDMIAHTYRLVDAAIGDLLGRYRTPKTNVLVLSDHGSAAFKRLVNLDAFFVQEGLMTLTGQKAGLQEKLFGLGYRVKQLLPEGVLQRLRGSARSMRDSLKKDLPARSIDWEHTVAVPMTSLGMIRLNVAGRDKAGIIEPGEEYEATCRAVSDIALSLRDPARENAPVFREVRRAVDIYHGPEADKGPDLVAIRADEHYHIVSPRSFGEKALNALRPVLTDADPTYTGTHTDTGILIASGPQIGQYELADSPGLVDIAPTILHLLGLPVPSYMDGNVIPALFDAQWLEGHPVLQRDEVPAAAQSDEFDEGYNEEEEAQVEKRLRDLGYL